MVLVGVILLLTGMSVGMQSIPMPQPTGNFQQDAQAGDAWFQASVARNQTAFAYSGGGLVLMGLGASLVAFGTVRPVYRYLAGESSEAVEIASEAVARGLAKGGFQGSTAAGPATVVKLKCKKCGYLDTEDATYCSKCGQPL